MMTRVVCAIAVGALSAGALAEDSLPGAVLGEGSMAISYESLFRPGPYHGVRNPGGDSYGAEPLLQDGSNAFLLDSVAGSVFTFDGTSEVGGASTAYTEPVDMIVFETFTPTATGGLIQVEIAAVDASGARVRWLPAGVSGPNGPFTSWRMDLGSGAAAANPIDVALGAGQTINVVSSGFTAFSRGGGALGTFALTLNSSGPTHVSGSAVVGLGGGNIAGFDMASIQMFWEYEVIPAPGGVMLLGLGGLALARRRR